MVVILPYCIEAKRCVHNALGYWSGLALCSTKVRSSRARCPATALIPCASVRLSGRHKSCPLYNLKTVKDFSMKLGTLVDHDEMMCHAQEP